MTQSSPRFHEVLDSLRVNYIPAQYAFVQFFSEHLVDCSRTFNGDLAQVLVLAILGQRTLEAEYSRAPDSSEPTESMWMSASRLSEVSGLPRETVRRKLSILVDRGWVVRDTKGGFAIASDGVNAKARHDLADIDARQTERMARLYLRLDKIAHRTPNLGRQTETEKPSTP